MKNDLKILNMSMAIITGTSTPIKARRYDIWNYEPGVLFFRDIVVLIAPKQIKEEVFINVRGKHKRSSD